MLSVQILLWFLVIVTVTNLIEDYCSYRVVGILEFLLLIWLGHSAYFVTFGI
jgi:hypothetical protein